MVRLAERRGVLARKDINRVQEWALAYLIAHDSKKKVDQRDEFDKYLMYLLDKESYRQVFLKQQEVEDPELMGEDGAEITPDDFSSIERWFARQESKEPSTISSEEFTDWM